MKIRYLIITFFLMASTILSAQKELNNYLEIAAENNPGLKAKFNEYLSSLEMIPQLGSLPDPQLAFGYFIQPVETRVGPQKAKISLNQMFPWFGTLGARENVATQNSKAKYEAFEENKSNLFFEVKSAYFELYFLERAIAISYENIALLESLRNLALIKLEAGKGQAVDEIRVEMELADLENKLALLKDKHTIQKVKFNKLLNIPGNSDIEIPDTLWVIDINYTREMVMDTIRVRNHQVLRLNYMLDSYRDKEVLARKGGLPNFVIGLDYTVIGKSDNAMADPSQNGQDAFLFPMIGISIPLYREKYNSMVKETVFMQTSVENEVSDKVNMLESLLEKVYGEYADANRRLTLFHKQLQLSDKALNILKTDYSTNGKNFEEVLRMEGSRLKYALELEKARSDKQAAIAFVNYLMGN